MSRLQAQWVQHPLANRYPLMPLQNTQAELVSYQKVLGDEPGITLPLRFPLVHKKQSEHRPLQGSTLQVPITRLLE